MCFCGITWLINFFFLGWTFSNKELEDFLANEETEGLKTGYQKKSSFKISCDCLDGLKGKLNKSGISGGIQTVILLFFVFLVVVKKSQTNSKWFDDVLKSKFFRLELCQLWCLLLCKFLIEKERERVNYCHLLDPVKNRAKQCHIFLFVLGQVFCFNVMFEMIDINTIMDSFYQILNIFNALGRIWIFLIPKWECSYSLLICI